MKILYYIHALYVGGAETLITNYLINLQKDQNEVVLVVNNEVDSFLTRKLTDSQIKIIPLNKWDRSPWCRYFELTFRKVVGYSGAWRKIYKTEKPDIVHVHTYCDSFELCDIDPKRVFYTFHSDVNRSLSLGSRKNYDKLCKYARAGVNFIALSKNMECDLRGKFATDNIFYLPNAIDLKAIRSCRYDKKDFLKKNGLPTDSFIVGHVGRFHSVKNHEKLFRVFQAVYKKCPSARLVLVGTGNPQEIAHIECLSKKYEVSCVMLMLGMRPDATAVMSVFDTFVLTSLSESFSLVLVEAQAQGVRCVTSNVVPPEVVCENCLTLDLNDSDEAWAEAILSGQAGNSPYHIEQYDIASVLTKMTELYTEALADK